MDALIKRFNGVDDGDLFITRKEIAYQKDMSGTVAYDEDYFRKVSSYDPEISRRINKGRARMVERHYRGLLLDIGVGNGEFIERRKQTHGFDVNPHAVKWLRKNGVFSDDFSSYDAFSFWDVLEHLPDNVYFKHIKKGAYVFASVPIIDDLRKIRESKHYRPNEHLYYWTEKGFVEWMALHGFRRLETSNHEIDAGRESIKAFAFKRDLPDYSDFIAQYQELHTRSHYGASAFLYLSYISDIVKSLNPRSILDYGCGRSDLGSHFWKDGERRIGRFDPAITEYKAMPEGRFDLVLCCDVMEHIPLRYVDRVFAEIKDKSDRVVFVISTKLARAKLPNGMNAHVTLLHKDEWIRWIEDVFGTAEVIETKWDHVLMVKT